MSKYTSKNEKEEIKAFIAGNRPREWRMDFPTAVDLDELFQDAAIRSRTRLWRLPNGELAAYAFVHFPYNNLTFEVRLSEWSNALENEILAWAEELMRAHYAGRLTDETLDCTCRAEDQHKIAFFKRAGFERQEVETLSFSILLDSPLPVPVLPPGFTLHPLDPQRDLQQAVELFHLAHGTSNFTLQDRMAIINTESYLPDLDLVVQAPDGRLAGNCICGVEKDRANGMTVGFTDPLVVHPEFQHQGLAKALLLHGLEELRRRGTEFVHLGTSSTNIGMQRAAEAAGLRCTARHAWFSKRLH